MDVKERRIEIALEFRKFGIAKDNIESFKLADEFLEASGIVSLEVTKPFVEEVIDTELLEERTRVRVAEVHDLGFVWNETRALFERGNEIVSMKYIEGYSDEEWDYMIVSLENAKVMEDDYQENKEQYPLISDDLPNEPILYYDFFKGKPYIEFEMANSTARVYLSDNVNDVEKDLSVKKGDKNFIMASSVNEESGLGLTIFKK